MSILFMTFRGDGRAHLYFWALVNLFWICGPTSCKF